ncbi:MAG: hypothetical protein ACLUUO_10285 [Sellimonas intestinalis]
MMKQTNEIVAPTFRQDMFPHSRIWQKKWQDFYGYDNIPTTLPRGEATIRKTVRLNSALRR